jgi:regulator of sigma E protease
MSLLLDVLSSALDLALVIIGFGLIIVIHEAGHFFAAKWAGIRVLAFAIGFGPPLITFRKGLGVRRGSTEREAAAIAKAWRDGTGTIDPAGISATEYRLNVLPLGGYVKMLGQDDADPSARSDEADSYQNCPPLKRMVVISAGVVANIVTAAIAFVLVFTIGLSVEPAVVGDVFPGSPAARATPVGPSASTAGQGLKTGDRIISVDGEPTVHFNDLRFKVAYAPPQTPVTVRVEREGASEPIDFSILPEVSRAERLLSIGVGPVVSGELPDAPSRRFRTAFTRMMREQGFGELEPGMRLTSIDGAPSSDPYAIDPAIDAAGGRPVTLGFVGKTGRTAEITLSPTPEMQRRIVTIPGRGETPVDHLLGITPVLAVRDVTPNTEAARRGLQPGDVFARLGTVEFPSFPAGILEINRSRGTGIGVVVLRRQGAEAGSGTWTRVDLGVMKVSSEGTLGFVPRDTAELSTLVSSGWRFDEPMGSGASLGLTGGSLITSVNGRSIETLADLRTALRELPTGSEGGSVTLGVSSATGKTGTLEWPISGAELAAVKSLGWDNPIGTALFAPAQISLRASGVGEALRMGVSETHRTMAMTYLTFARLFQGTVKVESLRGPVGIAHVGLSVVEKGPVWLLFFFALISVNLAVINFLPIPITDGGHMLFLIYEQVTGKVVSVAVQNIATIAGLALIGSLFLYVTYHDVTRVVRDISTFLGG